MRKLLIVTTLLVCLFAASSAAAAKRAPKSFYGVVAAAGPSEAEMGRLGQGRVGTLRIVLNWGEVQAGGPSSFDWSRYDSIIGEAAEQGITVFPTVYGSPSWAADQPNHPPSTAHLGEFQEFVKAAAERYGSNGLFWTLNPLIPRMPIIDWQPWNEVNSPSFWSRKPSPKAYKTLLVAFNAGLSAGDPSGKVVLAGLFLTPRIAFGVKLTKYLTGLYRAKARGLFDAVAVHPYATTPGKALQSVQVARDVMARFKDKSKPIYLTEVGWATGGQKTPLTVSAKKQASYVKSTYRLMAAKRKKLKIAGVMWYSLRDIGGSTWFNHTGLFSEGGSPKPSWFAYVQETGGTP